MKLATVVWVDRSAIIAVSDTPVYPPNPGGSAQEICLSDYFLGKLAGLNSVKAKLVKKPEQYYWSSVRGSLKGEDPFGIVDASKLLAICGEWIMNLKLVMVEPDNEFIHHTSTGRRLDGPGG